MANQRSVAIATCSLHERSIDGRSGMFCKNIIELAGFLKWKMAVLIGLLKT